MKTTNTQRSWSEYRRLQGCYVVVISTGDLTLQQHYRQDLKSHTVERVHSDNNGERNKKLPSTPGTLLPTKGMIRPRMTKMIREGPNHLTIH